MCLLYGIKYRFIAEYARHYVCYRLPYFGTLQKHALSVLLPKVTGLQVMPYHQQHEPGDIVHANLVRHNTPLRTHVIIEHTRT